MTDPLLHIAFIASEYHHKNRLSGGIATYMRKLGLALLQRGHQVSVIFLANKSESWVDQGIQVYAVKEKNKLSRHHLPALRWINEYWNIIRHLRSTRKLAQQAWKVNQNQKIDIFQTFNYKFPGYALCDNKKVPLVCKMASYAPNLRAANGGRRYVKGWIMDYFETQQVLKSDFAFAPSRFISDLFYQVEGVRPEVLRTPLDSTIINPDPAFYQQHLAGKKYLLYFGTLNRLKGVDLIADIIPEVFNQYPDLHFVFLGKNHNLSGNMPAFEYIQARNKGWQDRLFYHPPIAKPLLYGVIQHALGVLMPSRTDNYPNACLEATHLGIPVVGTYQSSLDEMIEEGETGFLANNDDSESLKRAVLRLLAMGPGVRQIMAQTIHNHIEEIQSEDRVGQLIQVYQNLINHE